MDAKHRPDNTTTIERISIPPIEPVTQAEIERRRALFDKVMALREKIGPIGISADELIWQARNEDDAADG